jgi:hypothetical protein
VSVRPAVGVPCSVGGSIAVGDATVQGPASVTSGALVNGGTPVELTASWNCAPQALGTLRVAANDRCACAGATLGDSGPHSISLA